MTTFAHRAERVQPSAIREFLALAGDPAITSFAGGYPDPTLFPMDELHGIYADLLSPQNAAALQYTASDGLPELRALVAARLTADGMPCTADDVLITQGGQQGLDLTAKLFIDAGDVIVTERPTFLGALIAFNPCEPDYRSVPMDDEGMDTDALEEVLRSTERVKLVYTVPDYQNPTGRTMSLARRRRLVELAEEYDVVILEDTPYRELRYEGERLPTIASLDTNRPGRAPGQLLEDPRARAPARLGPRDAGDPREALAAQARGRHPERHAEHAGRGGVPHPVRHRAAHRRHAPHVPAPARPHARDHGRALPGRHHLDPRPGWPVHLGDLPAGARPRGVPARRPHPARRGHRRAGDALLRRPPRGQPRPDELLRGAGRAARRRGAGHGGLLAEALA